VTGARPRPRGRPSPFLRFSVSEWSRLRDEMPMPLAEAELETLRGINERVSLDEVQRVYLPVSRLLNLYVAAKQNLHRQAADFLMQEADRVPFVIGLAGSVAVGKSTTARILQSLLARWPNHPKVDLVTTDGFLYPNAELRRRELMQRKGFPESYDRSGLLRFLAEVKSGRERVAAPLYSHLVYDVLPDRRIVVDRPDILIVEGLNVLQTGLSRPGAPAVYASDYLDFSIYLDASEAVIRSWYIERFLTLREIAFTDPRSYFHNYAGISDDEAVATANGLWVNINLKNLRENIRPTRDRADLVLHKSASHRIDEVFLRKI
jgi:type I pantothenate kinase